MEDNGVCRGYTTRGQRCKQKTHNRYCYRHEHQRPVITILRRPSEQIEPSTLDLKDTSVSQLTECTQRRVNNLVQELVTVNPPTNRPSIDDGLIRQLRELEIKKEDLRKAEEHLMLYENRLVLWEQQLIKRAKALQLREAIANLMLDDSSIFQKGINSLEQSLNFFKEAFGKFEKIKMEHLEECCVCYDHNITSDQLLPCGHPLCNKCKSQLTRPTCPLCREPIA